MRYKDVIILRITDFRSFFNFADFWAYRNLFSKTTQLCGFWNESLKRDKFIMACNEIVESWIKNIPGDYVIKDQCKLHKASNFVGKFLQPLVEQVDSFLNSHSELKDRDNCKLFLLSLYSLLKREEQLNRFLADKEVIVRILLNECSDFTKEYVEFNDNANIKKVELNICAKAFVNQLSHITLIRNRSEHFGVNFIDSLSNDLLFKLDPGKIALAVFNYKGEFIRELPTYAEYYHYGNKITLEVEENNRQLNLKYTQNGYTKVHRDIVSFSFDKDGYFIITNDKASPIKPYHKRFDNYFIEDLISDISGDEKPLYISHIGSSHLQLMTNYRIISL